MKSRASLLAVAAAGVSLALVAGFGRSLHGQEARGKDALMNPDQLTEPSPAMFKVNIDSSKGPIALEVHRDWAPNSADRFYNLVKRGYYDDNRFFRVLPGFLVQFGVNGDPQVWGIWRVSRMKDDPPAVQTKRIVKRGSIAFVSAGVNRKNPQVFISLVDDTANRWGPEVSVFGQVTSGMNIVDQLYSGYGEIAPNGKGPTLNGLNMKGNVYLTKEFPNLDYVKMATIAP